MKGKETMNKYQKSVCVAAVKGMENCYVLTSAMKEKEQPDPFCIRIKTFISFLYDAGDVAAEWEPHYGPIQVWRRCEETDEGAKEHYYYDFENSQPCNWSQLTVDRYQLKEFLVAGEFEYIFNVLKDWAEGR